MLFTRNMAWNRPIEAPPEPPIKSRPLPMSSPQKSNPVPSPISPKNQSPTRSNRSEGSLLLRLKMDWQGQKISEMLMQVLLVASAVAAFLVGYAMADFQLMLLVYAGGVVLTSLVTIPNWAFFNRHPLKWLDTAEADRHPRPHVSSTTAATGAKKKTGKNK